MLFFSAAASSQWLLNVGVLPSLLFASFVATLPIPVSLAIGSDRFKYFNIAKASSAKPSARKYCPCTSASHAQWAWFTFHKICVALIMRHKYDSHNTHK